MKDIIIAKDVCVKSMMTKRRKLFLKDSRFSVDCISLQDEDFTIKITDIAYNVLLNEFDNGPAKFDLIFRKVKEKDEV